jgi:hypothetical protein
MIATFPHHTLRGSHREVGRQHGEVLRSLIRAYRELSTLSEWPKAPTKRMGLVQQPR